jgi:hypothetical protein
MANSTATLPREVFGQGHGFGDAGGAQGLRGDRERHEW